jgi:hypothetical protein
MSQEKIPGYEIVEATVKSIDSSIKIEQVNYNFDEMTYKFYLFKNDKSCEVQLSHEFLDDLNDYTGSRESKYWVALEYTLKKRLSISMQIAGLIPFASTIFFEDNQDWEQDTGHEIEVCFSESDYEIFQDGLTELYHHLEAQRSELSHLKLKTFPYAEDQQRIQDMLLFRNEQVSKNGPCAFRDRISVTSRKHLKAAALIQLVFLEKEFIQGTYSEAVKKEIAAKISKILFLLSSPIFENIEVAEYLHGIQEEVKSHQSEVTVLDNTLTRNYDVVISFAGEDREHAGRLAELLKNDSFDVFYDGYEEHDLWGKNLYEHLTEVYSKRGKYCVMFLSKHYTAKQWPTLERRAAQVRAFKEHREYILPIRVDDTEIPGILDTVAYQDLRKKSIEGIYSILKRKLLPSEESAEIQSEPDLAKDMDLSEDAIKLLKFLSDKSEHALANDPLLTAQEVLDAVKLSEEELSIAADELEEKGFVKLLRTLGMGKVGFSDIGTTESLFASTDSYLKDWNPEKDSVVLAETLLKLSKEGQGVSIKEADDYLKWGPRRLNPALFLLIERNVVEPSKVLNPIYITVYVMLNAKIHRYIKSFS